MRQTIADLAPPRTPLLPGPVPAPARRAPEIDAAVEPPADPVAEPAARLFGFLDHLRASIGRYVAERRAAGAPLDRVLLEVRSLVREAEACEGWRDASETLLAQVAWWSINAYYDEPELQHVADFH